MSNDVSLLDVSSEVRDRADAAKAAYRKPKVTDCVVYKVSKGGSGQDRRSANRDDVSIKDADKDMISGSHKLWRCQQYDDIQALYRRVDAYCRGMSTPAKHMGNAHYLIHLDKIMDFEIQMDKFAKELEQLVDVFTVEQLVEEDDPENPGQKIMVSHDYYAEAIENSRARLKGAFDLKKFPSRESIRKVFTLQWTPKSLDLPANMERFDAYFMRKHIAKQEEQLKALTQVAEQALAKELREIVDGWVKTLTPKDDGSRKKFYESHITKLQEFFDSLPFRDISGSKELEELSVRAKQVIAGYSQEAVKSAPDAVRDSMRENMQQVARELEPLIGNAGCRSIEY